MDVKHRWVNTKDQASADNRGTRAARAEANQRFVRETLARREPQYARTVEHAAEAAVRAMAQHRSAARDAIVAVRAAIAAESRDALAAA